MCFSILIGSLVSHCEMEHSDWLFGFDPNNIPATKSENYPLKDFVVWNLAPIVYSIDLLHLCKSTFS